MRKAIVAVFILLLIINTGTIYYYYVPAVRSRVTLVHQVENGYKILVGILVLLILICTWYKNEYRTGTRVYSYWYASGIYQVFTRFCLLLLLFSH